MQKRFVVMFACAASACSGATGLKTVRRHPEGIVSGTVPIPASYYLAIRDDGILLAGPNTGKVTKGSAVTFSAMGDVVGITAATTSITMSASGATAYAADGSSGLSIIDVATATSTRADFTRATVGKAALDTARHMLYLPEQGPNVIEFDLNSSTVSRRVPMVSDPSGTTLINRVLRHPTKNLYYIGNFQNVWEIDATTGARVRSFPIGGSGSDIYLSPDVKTLYVARAPAQQASSIASFNLETGVAETPISLPCAASGMVLTPDSQFFFVGCSNANTIVMIDRASRTIARQIDVAAPTNQIAISPDGLTVAATSQAGITIIR